MSPKKRKAGRGRPRSVCFWYKGSCITTNTEKSWAAAYWRAVHTKASELSTGRWSSTYLGRKF